MSHSAVYLKHAACASRLKVLHLDSRYANEWEATRYLDDLNALLHALLENKKDGIWPVAAHEPTSDALVYGGSQSLVQWGPVHKHR